MQRLSPGARAIVNLLKNRGLGAGGYLPSHEVQPLFEDDPVLFRRSLRELVKQGFVEIRKDNTIALTEDGAELGLH